jgi:hypothetical protein
MRVCERRPRLRKDYADCVVYLHCMLRRLLQSFSAIIVIRKLLATLRSINMHIPDPISST